MPCRQAGHGLCHVPTTTGDGTGVEETRMDRHDVRGQLIAGTILLGLGLGGFFDGIVLHQILQWHHLISHVEPATTVLGLEVNTFWDGLFHLATYVMTVLGVALVWSCTRLAHAPWSTRILAGGMLLGWGLFNLVEGIIDHQILGIHHVRPGPDQLAWDLGFLAWGALMAGAGWLLLQGGLRATAAMADRQHPSPEPDAVDAAHMAGSGR